MCGVIGLVTPSSLRESDAEVRVREALRLLRHRGPDDQGLYHDRNIWLAHARLSILDLSAAGHQPMESACGRFAITYNGEIYNFRELAAEYALDGLRSSSDTEVVLRLFARFGVDSLIKLNGMFAFSVYDRQTRRIWLVRDRFGIKPLYYRLGTASLAFASEIKGIYALTSQTPRCNTSALNEWLYYGNALGGHTLHDGIHQLLPGSYLELDVDSFSCVTREYWSLRKLAESAGPARESAPHRADEIRGLLEQAVSARSSAMYRSGSFFQEELIQARSRRLLRGITRDAWRHTRSVLISPGTAANCQGRSAWRICMARIIMRFTSRAARSAISLRRWSLTMTCRFPTPRTFHCI